MSSQDDISTFSHGGLVGEAFYAHFNTLSETVELINSDADKAVELRCVGISLKIPEKAPPSPFVMQVSAWPLFLFRHRDLHPGLYLRTI